MSLITTTTTHPGPRPAKPPMYSADSKPASNCPPPRTAQILPLLEALQKRLGIDPQSWPLMKFLLAMLTLNTLSGRSLSWITLPGNSIPLTQGLWMFRPATAYCHVPNWRPHLVPCSRSAGRLPTASTDHQPCHETPRFCPITPAHRKPPWLGCKHGTTHYQTACCAPIGRSVPAPEIRPAEYLKLTGHMVGSLFIRGHSAGSYQA